MTSVRAAKSKGSSFEMDCEASLQQIWKDCYRTHERGYILEYDLRSDEARACIECKRLKAVSWSQAEKYLNKLAQNAPEGYACYLLFKSNFQPCLVMTWVEGKIMISTFETIFNTPFIKHESTRKKNKKGDMQNEKYKET